MEQSNTEYKPVEIRDPVLQPVGQSSIARVLRALFIEHRLPYRLQQAIERILYFIGLKTKTVKMDGLLFRVRRLSWDERFLSHAFEREDYTKGGFSLKETDTVIDIGANIGAFSIYAAKRVPKGRVIAFEPAADNYELLVRNASLNRLSNLTPVRAAVAGRSGRITLFRGEASGLHSTTEGHSADCTETEVVDAVSLEDIFLRYKIEECKIVKLNCEGAEYEILYSTPAFVFKKIERIVMEYHAKENKRQKANELVNYLLKHKYKVVEYTDYLDHDCGFLCVKREENKTT